MIRAKYFVCRLRWLVVLAACAAMAPAAEPPHPILNIGGSSNPTLASNIVNNYTETQYVDNFVPRQSPRNNSYGFVPAVVAGDTGWAWSSSTPNQITSTPSGTVFPTTPAYPVYYQNVLVTSGNTVSMPYYLRAGSSSAKSMVFELINHNKRNKLRSDLNVLAPTYMASGSTHATRNQAYARRIAVALLDWAHYMPDYVMTAKNSASYINAGPDYVLSSDLQRASDHNGLAHEWADDELLAFDAIYDSPALAQLSTELGYDVRQYITDNLYCNEGDFIAHRVPINVAIASNLSGPYTVLALVARVLNRPDYIDYMDRYLDATVTRKIQRDGTLSEGMGYSIGYINENLGAARNTRNYFLTRAADTPQLQAISTRANTYVSSLEYGRSQWERASLPNGQLPSFGDTPFNTYFGARNTGTSVLLPAYGSVSMGAGATSGTAIQVNQCFAGDNNHMRSDTCAYVLWAFGNEVLGNVRYHNGTPGRQFTEQILAYNAVTIDRSDMTSPSASTYGNGDLTLYEPGKNGLAVTELDGQRAYSNKASRYQRIMMLNTVDIDRPYLVDVFRVTGGTTHDYVWHGSIRYDQTAQCSFALTPMPGEYPMLEGSEVWVEPTSSGSSFPYYGFFRDMSTNPCPGNFQIAYLDAGRTSPRDTKLWMTADPAQYTVYLGRTPVPARASGEPDNWWVNGLWRPSTIIRKRAASGPLNDLFVSVIEPLKKGAGAIQSVERLPMTASAVESVGLRVTFTDGRTDTYLVNLHSPQVAGASGGSSTISTADGSYSLTGRIGLQITGSADPRVWTVNASDFQYPGGSLAPSVVNYSGSIIGETRVLDGAACDALVTETPLPLGTELGGKHLSMTFGTLSGSGRNGISQMFEIDRVIQSGSEYQICLKHDHCLEITNALTVNGSGSDIWGTADQFHYAYQAQSGDMTLTARVLSQANTNSWAKSGLMIRQSTAANSAYVGLYVTPGNGVSVQYRAATGAGAIDFGRSTGLAAPRWLRLARAGDVFTAYESADGANWLQVGSGGIAVPMASSVLAGLAVCSHNNSALNATSFDNVSLPLSLTGTDIGAVGLAGSVEYSTITVEQVAPLRTFTGENTFEIALSDSQAAAAPATPTGLTAIAGNRQISLSWDAAADAESYRVKRALVSGGPYETIGNPAAANFTDMNVVNGTRYYYVISAVNDAGESLNSPQVSAAPSVSLPTGLVARYTFESGTAADSSGSANHGVLNGGVSPVTDTHRGKVLSFDGANGSYIRVTNSPSLNAVADQITVAMWLYTNTTAVRQLIEKGGTSGSAWYTAPWGIRLETDRRLHLHWGNVATLYSSAIAANTWTHVALVYNSTLGSNQAKFYINGVLNSQADWTTLPSTNTNDLFIGTDFYNNTSRWAFIGRMDDVRIYSSALTAGQIADLMLSKPGDLTLDGNVDMADLAELSRGWQTLYDIDTLFEVACHWLE
ncbi:MAG: hypothetical protein LLF76_07350 [Planctomycetaceae bacterium]|nr:hypothetical protein [Planctomycetaceae bacterium]